MSGGRSWHKIVVASFWLLVVVTTTIYSRSHGLGPQETLSHLAEFTAQSQFGPLLFAAAYTLLPLFFFSAALLTMFSGALFGPVWGVVYTIVGSSVSASFAYVLGRYFGEDFVSSRLEGSRIAKLSRKLREQGFLSVLTMRLMFLPFDLVNFVSGAVRVKFLRFWSATILGSLPGTISLVYLGASGGFQNGVPSVSWKAVCLSLALIAVSVLVSRKLTPETLAVKEEAVEPEEPGRLNSRGGVLKTAFVPSNSTL